MNMIEVRHVCYLLLSLYAYREQLFIQINGDHIKIWVKHLTILTICWNLITEKDSPMCTYHF